MKDKIRHEIKKDEELVAFNIKRRRIILGLSQKNVADILGVSVQQVQKYENFKNRISAGKLPTLATLLKMPLKSFFITSTSQEAKN